MQGKLFDIKTLPQKLGLTLRTKTVNGDAVKLRDNVRWIRVTTFGSFLFRESFDESERWKKVDLLNSERGEHDMSIYDCRKISGRVKPAKLLDLKKQMPYIPETFRPFYNNLIEGDEESDSEQEENSTADDTCGTTSRYIYTVICTFFEIAFNRLPG